MPEGLPPKVVEVYRSVGKIMSRYSAGKVPKAFKIIPNLKNWEEVSSPPACLDSLSTCMSASGVNGPLCPQQYALSCSWPAQAWAPLYPPGALCLWGAGAPSALMEAAPGNKGILYRCCG